MALNGYVQFWVRGKAVGTPLPGMGVGTPICLGCEKPLDTGFLFRGNGAVCRECMDRLRNELWQHMSRVIGKNVRE